MKKIKEYIKENYKAIVKTALYISSVFLIAFLFSKETRFKYDYQKGSTWRHSNLIAPYDIPIYKSDNEIKVEKDSILKEIHPYFAYDVQVGIDQINLFRLQLDSVADVFFKSGKIPFTYRKEFEKTAIIAFDDVYSVGIIQNDEVFSKYRTDDSLLFILRNNIAEEFDIKDLYTLKTAYTNLKNKLTESLAKMQISQLNRNSIVADFLEQLHIEDYIQANLNYDDLTTEKEKATLLEEISLSRDMIKQGEIIVLQGEFVNERILRILRSFEIEYDKRFSYSSRHTYVFFGYIVLSFISVLIVYLFLFHFRKDIFEDIYKQIFILVTLVLNVGVTYLVVRYRLVSIYVIPYALFPVVLRTFFDSRLASLINTIALLINGFFVPNAFQFVFMNFMAGNIAIFSLRQLYRRDQLFATSLMVILTYCLSYIGIILIQEGSIEKVPWKDFLWFVANGVLLLSSYPMIYFVEKIFGFLSDLTLLELTDLNHPLLRQLANKAPGTFQHSIQVANIAEETIYKIGGNGLLVRAGALFHDIGKQTAPMYFIENQRFGINPHDKLDFIQSSNVIISHVQHGVELANKHRLPDEIIDFIKTHHGTMKVEYFYRSFIHQNPDVEVDLSKFTYPGTTPNSKETAVLMMADAVEAATRSMKSPTEETMNEMIDKVINHQIEEGQFYNSNITFRDISLIKMIFKQRMKNIYHARIEYPNM